jgi:hypothetical protein
MGAISIASEQELEPVVPPVESRLASIDPNDLSPREALQILFDLKALADQN